jgi:hypothetical protein
MSGGNISTSWRELCCHMYNSSHLSTVSPNKSGGIAQRRRCDRRYSEPHCTATATSTSTGVPAHFQGVGAADEIGIDEERVERTGLSLLSLAGEKLQL